MNIAEQIEAIQKQRKLNQVEVPEWPDSDGNPTIIYFRHVSVGDSVQILKSGQLKMDPEARGINMMIPTVINMALDSDGNRIFSNENDNAHAVMLRNEPITAITRIFEAMMGESDASEKN